MCGITGFVNRDGLNADRGIVERMTATLAHRGPDGDGIYVVGRWRWVTAGCRSSTSPAAPSRCRMKTATVWVTYNGELYNELEIRRELESKGHRYQHRPAIPKALSTSTRKRGSISSAGSTGCSPWRIWDQPRRRAGAGARPDGAEAPLYARLPGGGLAFGSEPKALLAHPEVGRELDLASLARYLFYEYIPAPAFDLASDRKLPRASCSGLGRRVRFGCRRYWDPPAFGSERPARLRRYGRAVLDRVSRGRGATPAVGCAPRSLLVGGRRFVERRGRASARSSRRGTCERSRSVSRTRTFDESSHARAVAAFLGTDHHERTFSVKTRPTTCLPEVAGWLDEPFGDASILPTHLLSRFARERGQGRTRR